jgi:hypothetical protein
MYKSLGLLIVCIAVAMSNSLAFAAFQFEIGDNGPAGNRWELGSGWGTGSGQLDAVFSIDPELPLVSFSLDSGDKYSFKYGSVELIESYIGADETDNLDVAGYLLFDLPAIGAVKIPATVTTYMGTVSDGTKDLKINFDPVVVDFGNGGKLKVSLSDLDFYCQGVLCVTACVELYCTPTSNVPEPRALFIWSLLCGLGLVVGWRKAKQPNS